MNENLLLTPLKLKYASLPGRLFSAPLAGFSTPTMRSLFRQGGADCLWSEMYHVREILNRPFGEIPIRHETYPFVIQLFGKKDDPFTEAFLRVEPYCDMVDINFACPVKKIVKAGGGAVWLRDIEAIHSLLTELTSLSSSTVRKDISAKVRLGFDRIEIREIAAAASAGGASLLTVHARTADMMFGGTPLYDEYEQLRDCRIPLILNGNITTPETAVLLMDRFPAAGLMIGRGALENPGIFFLIKNFLKSGYSEKPTTADKRAILRRYYEEWLNDPAWEKNRHTFSATRKTAHWLVKGMHGAHALKELINTCTSAEELLANLDATS